MSWRPAKSLETLRKQLNEMFPNRSRISDGIIGNAEHSARLSDHNPNSRGVVTAFDIAFDTDERDGIGVDARKLARVLSNSKDKRIKYLIFERKITTRGDVTKWKPYFGKNPHNHHLHISVSSDPKLYDDGQAWDLTGIGKSSQHQFSTGTPAVAESKAAIPDGAFQPLVETAEILPEVTAGEKSADKSQAIETTASKTVETPTGQIKKEVNSVNEQNVNEPARITEPQPQGFKAKLTAGIASIAGGTLLYDGLGKISGIQFTTQAIYIICFVIFIAFLGFCVWAVLDTWKANKKTELEVLANTAVDRKNIVWVKPEQK